MAGSLCPWHYHPLLAVPDHQMLVQLWHPSFETDANGSRQWPSGASTMGASGLSLTA